jgi:hypothetical protein
VHPTPTETPRSWAFESRGELLWHAVLARYEQAGSVGFDLRPSLSPRRAKAMRSAGIPTIERELVADLLHDPPSQERPLVRRTFLHEDAIGVEPDDPAIGHREGLAVRPCAALELCARVGIEQYGSQAETLELAKSPQIDEKKRRFRGRRYAFFSATYVISVCSQAFHRQ